MPFRMRRRRYLARQILAASGGGPAPRVITTLHGTDITLLGGDPSYKETVAFCIQQSDGVTAVSESLKADTYRELGVHLRHPGDSQLPGLLAVPPSRRAGLRARLAPEGQKVLVHVSNFRPVKRPSAVVEVFAKVRRRVPATLLMVGDGPEVAEAMRLAKRLKVGGDVQFLGMQEQLVPLLSIADVFILPSAQESFGLAALEAMACEVPVIASRVGGLPEVDRRRRQRLSARTGRPRRHGRVGRAADDRRRAQGAAGACRAADGARAVLRLSASCRSTRATTVKSSTSHLKGILRTDSDTGRTVRK